MIDINLIRNHFDDVVKRTNQRHQDFVKELTQIKELDFQIRTLKTETQELEAKCNSLTKEIASFIKSKLINNVEEIKTEIIKNKALIEKNNQAIRTLNQEFQTKLLLIPNLIDKSVPLGKSETENRQIRKVGIIQKKSNLPHWEIAEKFKLVDFARATKLSGSRFVLYQGNGAMLMRALLNFMLDQHYKNGYVEFLPPLIVNEEILIGTGQLPKFAEDQFKIANGNQYLIPTAEVPLTNIYRNEIIKEELLPIKMTAYTPCFRLEAGSAGRDTRGLIRLHQFNKVELVQIVSPVNSLAALENLLLDAEKILNLLAIPYEVVELCSGDIGFSAAKTYDINLWMPNQGVYREVSSCSNCSDFQTRRMNLRMIDKNGKKSFPHSLNGSGLAIDRVFAAILENYYDEKLNEIVIPEVLQTYLNFKKITLNVSRETLPKIT